MTGHGLLEPDNFTVYQLSKTKVGNGARPISPVQREQPFGCAVQWAMVPTDLPLTFVKRHTTPGQGRAQRSNAQQHFCHGRERSCDLLLRCRLIRDSAPRKAGRRVIQVTKDTEAEPNELHNRYKTAPCGTRHLCDRLRQRQPVLRRKKGTPHGAGIYEYRRRHD